MTEKTYKRVFAKEVEYRGIKFRSKLEADFAMYLDGVWFRYKGESFKRVPIRWEYESKEFLLIKQENWVDKTEFDKSVKKIKRNKKHTLQKVIYTPDFYLPDFNLHIETKGFQFNDGLFKMRFRLFKHKYPDEAIWLVTSHSDFKKLDEVLEALRISEEK